MESPWDTYPGLASAVLEVAPLAVVVVSLEGIVEYFNPFFARVTGRELRESRGGDYFETFLPERDRDSGRSVFRRACEGEALNGYAQAVLTEKGEERVIRWFGRNVRDATGSIHHVALGEDVTERIASEHARREAEERLRIVADASHEVQILARVNREGRGRVVAVNDAYLRALRSVGVDASSESIVGKTRHELAAQFGLTIRTHEESFLELAARSGQVVSYEFHQSFGDLPVIGDATITPFPSGEEEHFLLWTLRNLRWRKPGEREAKPSAELLREAEALAVLGSWEWSAGSSEVWLSEEAARLSDLPLDRRVVSIEELLGSVHPDDRARVDETLRHSRREQASFEFTHRVVLRSGEVRLLRQRGRSLPVDGGGPPRTLGTCLDVTERVRVERRLERELAEKDVLLREMHHRVKNNLQLISSLLLLQARKASSREVSEELREVRGRVAAMALVHEKLESSSKIGASIEFSSYVRDLCRTLCRTHASRGGVALDIEGQAVDVPSELAIPLGLLLAEICSNSLKHAFPKGRGGRLRVGLLPLPEGLLIRAEDDGVGCADICRRLDSFDHANALSSEQGLGLQLIGQLVDQLGAKLSVESDASGTRYAIEVELPSTNREPQCETESGHSLDVMGAHVLLQRTPFPGVTFRRRPSGGLVVETFNQAANALADGELHRLVGADLDEFYDDPPVWVKAAHTALDEQRVITGEFEARFRAPSRKPRVMRMACIPITTTLVLIYSEEITQLRHLEERESRVMRELRHRVHANLAMVRSMARRDVGRCRDLHEFEGRFREGLDLLARVHEALAAEHYEGLAIEKVMGIAAMVVGEPDWQPSSADGVDIHLAADAVSPFCLAARDVLAEAKATNGGDVFATCERRGERLIIEWRLPAEFELEPPLATMLEALVCQDLNGRLRSRSEAECYFVVFDLPASFVESRASPAVSAPGRPHDGTGDGLGEPLDRNGFG